MSRTLERLRRATGDPLLVRAGRGLVPTPHATALRDRVHALTLEAKSVLRPSQTHLDLGALDQTFTIRAGEWVHGGACKCHRRKHYQSRTPCTASLRSKARRRSRSSQGWTGFVDTVLTEARLKRVVQVVVPGFPDALRVAADSDLVALVPRASLMKALRKDGTPGLGVQDFEVPLQLPEILVYAMWHPRVDADPAQRWLRQTAIAVCKNSIHHREDRS